MPLYDKLRIGSYIIDGTTGSILFVDSNSKISQNNSLFFWDNSNNRLGIGNNTPTKTLDVTGTGKFSSTLDVLGHSAFGANASTNINDIVVISESTNLAQDLTALVVDAMINNVDAYSYSLIGYEQYASLTGAAGRVGRRSR